jgi:amino acid transporter
MWNTIKKTFIGTPLASSREHTERLSIPIGLAVFASDALSSTAYATEEILLALVGTAYAAQANLLSLPIAIAIGLLMALVILSYRQVVLAFPKGGGAFEVAKEELGVFASQVAGSALLIDYTLTVAVSVSAGVEAIISTGLLGVEYKILLAIVLVLLVTLINLRGVKESGTVIAFPAYTFIFIMAALLITGYSKVLTGQVPAVPTGLLPVLPQQPANMIVSTGLILALLKAFSQGCSALTGIEAISNGVKAFKEPAPVNANRTLVLMGIILASIFIGMTGLAYLYHIVPSTPIHETMVSQIGRAVFGSNTWLYYILQTSTMIILVLAANTSFSGFPRLSAILAENGFLPRQLMSLGDRLVYSNGILALSVCSIIMILVYKASTHNLIPLYAVGVFLSFSLAQAGMILHHRKAKLPGWQLRSLVNLVGFLVTSLVTILLSVEKFYDGAWVVLVAVPILIVMFHKTRNHYQSINQQLVLPHTGYCPVAIEHTVLVLVSSLHKGTIPALEYAKTISGRVEAVHVELSPESSKRLRDSWDDWGCGIPLTILESPFRSIGEPLLAYIDEVEDRYEHDLVTIIVPEFVPKRFWHNLLHNQTSIMIKALLREREGKVVTTVRYHLTK